MYTAGFAVQRALGLVMLPLYTRAISPTEYGGLGILLSAAGVLVVLFSAGLDIWIVRTHFQLASDPPRRDEALASVWRFLLIYPLTASLVLSAIAWPFLGQSHTVTGLDVLLMLVSTAVNVSGGTLPLNVLRARQALRPYLTMTAVTALTTPALTVLFVVILKQGIEGWLVAAGLANIVTFGVAAVVVPWQRHIRMNWRAIKRALTFSIPLIPHFISSWALQLADRFVIAGIVSGPNLGLYSLAANLSTPVMILVLALSQGFMPTYAKAGAQRGASKELANVVTLQLTIVVGFTLAGLMLGPTAVKLLSASDYHAAAPLVPWIVLGYGFLGIYAVPMSGATLGAGRQKFAWVASASSALTNVGLLVIFVPTYGIYAAAVASAAGYFVLLVLMAVWAHARDNPVQYEWSRLVQRLVVAGVTYIGAALTLPHSVALGALTQVGWLTAFAAVMVVLELDRHGRLRRRHAGDRPAPIR